LLRSHPMRRPSPAFRAWTLRLTVVVWFAVFLSGLLQALGLVRRNLIDAAIDTLSATPQGETVLFLILVTAMFGSAVSAWSLWSLTEGGLFPAWRKAADDPRYGKIAPPSIAGWLHGEG